MAYDKFDLEEMTLQRLAYILPQSPEEEAEVKAVFEQRASVSDYRTLTSIDVKIGWQEGIIQKYVDERRATMAPENAAVLNDQDQQKLDASVITKEIELELQAKLDAKNGKKTVAIEDEPEYVLTLIPATSSELSTLTSTSGTSTESITLTSTDLTTPKKKRGKASKK